MAILKQGFNNIKLWSKRQIKASLKAMQDTGGGFKLTIDLKPMLQRKQN